MKRLLAVIVVLALAWLALRGQRANAVPVCFPEDERLSLRPMSATYNNLPTRLLANGLSTSDAGIEFYVTQGGQIDALQFEGQTGCPANAKEVTIELTDPWTGDPQTLTLRSTP
jgi:hypothetical protein